MANPNEKSVPIVYTPEKRIVWDGSKTKPAVKSNSKDGLQLLETEDGTRYTRLQDGGFLNLKRGIVEDYYHNPADTKQDGVTITPKTVSKELSQKGKEFFLSTGEIAEPLGGDYFSYKRKNGTVGIIHKSGNEVATGYVPRKLQPEELGKVQQFIEKYNTAEAKLNEKNLRLGSGVKFSDETASLLQHLAIDVEEDIDGSIAAGILIPLTSLDGRYQAHIFARNLAVALDKYKEINSANNWSVIGESVIGNSHKMKGLPNQDAMMTIKTSEGNDLIAVSDGHGSEKSFRSDRGSKLGVQVLTQEMATLERLVKQGNINAAIDYAQKALPSQVVEGWRKLVDHDMQQTPLSEVEFSKLTGTRDEQATVEVKKNPRLAYGATLLGAARVGDYLFCFALGDGDITITDEGGNISLPLPKDESMIANETTSLCQADAVKNMRVAVVDTKNLLKPMVMISTDGFSNSYATDEAFYAFPRDLQKRDNQQIKNDLKSWLEQVSAGGSGDDVTALFLKS